jgi:hypothetical protein
MVSKHFNYTEEYVLTHSPSWLTRKFKQAQREQFQDHQLKVVQGFQSAMLMLDVVFNKGKDFQNILPPTYEQAVESIKAKQEVKSQYVQGKWWLNSN